MASNKIDLGCPQTKGVFQVRGIVSGVDSQNFYSESNGKNGKPYRKLNFAVEFNKNEKIYISLFGAVQDNVYFSKTVKDESGKGSTETRTIKWADRMSYKAEGFRMIGVRCGLSKTINDKGQEVNDNKTYTPFDACYELHNSLEDGMSVFVGGNISYSTYNGKHMINFEPNQVSLTSKPINFDADDFKPQALFTQAIVFDSIKKNPDADNEAVISAKVVNYSTIEDTELYVRDAKLARSFKSLKPYTHISVYGDIIVEENLEDVNDSEDGGVYWGEANKMKRVASPFVRKLIVTGAEGDSIDREKWSEEVIEKALAIIAANKQARADYGKSDDDIGANDWGNKNNMNLDDDIANDDFDLDDL